MRAYLKLFPLILWCVFGINNVFAAPVWSAYAKVRIIYPYYDGRIFIYHTGVIVNPAGCWNEGYYTLELDHPNRDAIYTAITTALAADRQIQFLVDETECVGVYPKLLAVLLWDT